VTPDRTDANPDENAEHGVLEEIGNLDTASITILGGHIAQVNVDLPVTSDEDDLDDDVIEDEVPLDEADLAALDAPRLPSTASADDHGEIVHDPHVEQLPTGDIILEPHDAADEAESVDDDVHDAEIVDEAPQNIEEHETPDADHPAADADPGHGAAVDGGSPDEGHDGDDASDGDDLADDAARAETDVTESGPAEADSRVDDLADAEIVDDVELFEADAAEPIDAVDPGPLGARSGEIDPPSAEATEARTHDDPERRDDVSDVDDAAESLTRAPWVALAADEPEDGGGASTSFEPATVDAGSTEAPDTEAPDAEPETAAVEDVEVVTVAPVDTGVDDVDDVPIVAAAPAEQQIPAPRVPAPAAADQHSAPAAPAEVEADPADAGAEVAPAGATASVPTTRAERAATGVIGTIPLTRRSAHQADEAARADRAHSLERVRTPSPEVTLSSKRIGEIDDARESSDLLTADRLLDPRQIARPEPEGLWQQLVYSVSRHRINLGDGRRARQRKDLDRRISAPLAGGARFVPVLSRKGGVGKTTVTSLLGMALADARDDRIIAVDANPDRGTLADRAGRSNGRTVRDLVRSHDEMAGYNDVSSIVARDATRLDVLASDSDPRVSEAFSDEDYRQVADVAAHYYSIVLTDTGTGIVHSVMGATLELADTLVIVAGLSVDEARLASETLTWLETNGYSARVRDAVVVLNNSRPGTPLVRESELETHFRSRVRTVIRMPYDARIAAGSAIAFRELQPSTRQAARELAAAVVEGLRTPAAAA